MSETPHNERDERLSSIYRAALDDAPPPALDDAIRAAARREVGARPRPAGAPFARWQMPLSIAAVLILCVSLVVVMREEGSELTQVPRADAPAPAARERASAPNASAVPKVELVPEASRSKNLGFKLPSETANAPAAGADTYALAKSGASTGLRRPSADTRDAKRSAEADATATPVQRALPSAFPEKKERGAVDQLEPSAASAGKLQARRDVPAAEPAPSVAESRSRGPAENAAARGAGGVASSVEPARVLRQEQTAADHAPARAEVQAMARPAPATPPAMQAAPAAAESSTMVRKSAGQTAELVAQMSRLPPEKWLERIEELRRQGRVDDARAGLSEFRKRYPDYVLPPPLRDW